MSQLTHSCRHIAIVGAGLAGLSAAIKLLRQGHQISIFEAAPQAGGRARGVPHGSLIIDNGQHICLGAYQATLALLHDAGLEEAQVFTRLPLALHMHDGAHRMSLITPSCLPAPLHLLWGLLTARGLSLKSKGLAIRWLLSLKKQAFKLSQDTTVEVLLKQGRQTETAISMLWEPLCLAALNTPVNTASAQVFLNVLHDSFQHRRSDSDFLIANSDLSSALIAPLIASITASGGKVFLRTPVLSVSHGTTDCVLETAQGKQIFDDVILAVGPHQLKTIASDLPAPVFDYQAITTVYLQYSSDIRLPYPVMGLCHGQAQWVFDRGRCCQQPGLLAIVISAHRALPGDKTDLIRQCIAELNQALSGYGWQLNRPPLWTQVITEKRATFSCTPDLQRPSTTTMMPHIYLAGDYITSPYPATIEAAVRSGCAAEAQLLASDSPLPCT